MNAENDQIIVGAPMPQIGAVRHVHGHVLSVTWAAGTRQGITEDVDLAPAIMQYRVFLPLRGDLDLFAAISLDEGGDVLLWDGGRLDMAATTVERLAEESMTNAAFRAFLERHRLTLDAAGAVLGISRRQAAYYAKDRPVPRLVALACTGYEAREGHSSAGSF